ncbi:MAG: PIG-L deacetylase family protein [Candidatus Helarchaeota archaeon]
MKVLFIVPHPDDLEFACGSTAARLVDEGHEVHELCMTAGEYGIEDDAFKGERISKIRRREIRKAAKIIGIKKLELFGLIDGHVKVNVINIDKLKNYINKINPQVVFCPDPLFTVDPHNDHVNTGYLTYFAVKRMKNRPLLIFFYTFSANYYLPCTHLKRSHQAFDQYVSQNFANKLTKVFNSVFKLISGITVGKLKLVDTFRIQDFKNKKRITFKQHFFKIIFTDLFSFSLPDENRYKPTPEELNLKEFRFKI